MIEAELASADIYIAPPQDGQLSEEDSADEDQPNDINHLSGRQLSAEAEVARTALRPPCYVLFEHVQSGS